MAFPTYTRYYDLDAKRWVVAPGGKFVTVPLRLVIRQTPVFAIVFCQGSTVVSVGSSPTWEFIIKGLGDYDGVSLAYTTTCTETGSGTTSLYSFSPSLNSSALNAALGSADYLDAALQISFTVSGVTDKTTAYSTRVFNDYATNSESGGGTLNLASGSTLSTTGAFANTLRFTAATDVTFPTSGTLATTAGVASAYQPLNADLTALAALSGTNTLYYRSAANTWSAVTIGSGLSFSAGTLVSSGGFTPGGANSLTTGGSLTASSGSTVTLNGAFAGTPTGGTLNLAALTLTLPSTFVTTTATQTLTNKTISGATLSLCTLGTTLVQGAVTYNSGAVLAASSGSTVTLNGAFAGTPTGGTLNLANLTLTLPTALNTPVIYGSAQSLTEPQKAQARTNIGVGTTDSPTFAVVTESTTARTLALTDAQSYIRLTHASGCAITVPPQSDVAWVADTEIAFRVAAAGAPSIVEGSGVTVNNKAAATSLAQHATFALKRVASDTWDLV